MLQMPWMSWVLLKWSQETDYFLSDMLIYTRLILHISRLSTKNQRLSGNHGSFQWEIAFRDHLGQGLLSTAGSVIVCRACQLTVGSTFWKMKRYICNPEVWHWPFWLKCDLILALLTFGAGDSCCWRAALRIVHWAASLASTQ